ncbi:DJ-1/PfpI family protein [Desulfospira joergensenii]|uniref:DJ-1/PfpI family protein n=1 Tax=Desulfospira joergensenii TaxID=53329 RepID=UPI000412608C|nr:DJ-1/PfpI family protein [Desulfospira joergensenii]
MNRKFDFVLLKIFIVLSLIFYTVSAFAGEKATKAECIDMTNKVVQMIEKEGLDAVIPKLNDKKGPFVWKDAYVFLLDTKEARLLAHPYLPKRMHGIRYMERKDINGKEFFREFLEKANSEGKGWVDYVYADPHGRAREKITYVLKSEKANIIASAGIFTDKKLAGPKIDIPDMTLPDIKGKKVALIIGNRGYEDSEFSVPKKMIEKAGGITTVFSVAKGKAYGMYGQVTDVSYVLDDVSVPDFDAIVFVGGSGSGIYHNDPKAHKIAQDAVKNDKVLAAICWAPVTLANAHVIDGKMATVNPNEKKRFQNGACIYTADRVTVDGKIITANGPEASVLFGKTIIESLKL